MNDFTFTQKGFADYLYWQSQDRKILKKINSLLDDIKRNGAMQGTGKPERLKYWPGYSRRIDEKNRLVYDIDDCRISRLFLAEVIMTDETTYTRLENGTAILEKCLSKWKFHFCNGGVFCVLVWERWFCGFI